MIKHIARGLTLATFITLTACGGGGSGNTSTTDDTDGGDQSEAPTDQNPDMTTDADTNDEQPDIDASFCSEILDDLNLDIPVTLQNGSSDCDYYVERNARFTSTLTIEPGTSIMLASNADISVRGGSISAVGTATMPIQIFGEQRVQGFWEGIIIDDVRSSELEYIEI